MKEYQKMIADQAMKHGTSGEIDQSFWELKLIPLSDVIESHFKTKGYPTNEDPIIRDEVTFLLKQLPIAS